MGPQLLRCGNAVGGVADKLNILASMGPQLLRCGNILSTTCNISSTMLQWGRSFYAAEILKSRGNANTGTPASMGPQLLRCGNLTALSASGQSPKASMGPQLLRCGNAGSGGKPPTTIMLQWGRSFYAAEIRNLEYVRFPTLGFNGAAAFTLRKWRCGSPVPTPTWASMGPQLLRCGNTQTCEAETAARGFNGAAAFTLRKS